MPRLTTHERDDRGTVLIVCFIAVLIIATVSAAVMQQTAANQARLNGEVKGPGILALGVAGASQHVRVLSNTYVRPLSGAPGHPAAG